MHRMITRLTLQLYFNRIIPLDLYLAFISFFLLINKLFVQVYILTTSNEQLMIIIISINILQLYYGSLTEKSPRLKREYNFSYQPYSVTDFRTLKFALWHPTYLQAIRNAQTRIIYFIYCSCSSSFLTVFIDSMASSGSHNT